MMMERAKTAPAPEEATDNSKSITAPPLQDDDASPEQRVQDLERRLNDLGGDDSAVNVVDNAAIPAKQQPAAVASQTGKNNPLLKRIQAAQERARQAEQKEKLAKAAAEAEKQRKLDEQRQLEQLEQERIQKAQSTLRSAAANALEDKSRSIMAQLEGKVDPSAIQQTQQQQPMEAGVPIMKSLDPPPPSFDSMKFPPPMSMQQQLKQPPQLISSEMVGHGMNSRVLMDDGSSKPQPPPAPGPPSFDFVEQQQQQQQQQVQPSAPAPTAPSISPGGASEQQHHVVDNHLHGIMPVAAPPLGGTTQADMPPPPPSFAIFESQQEQQSSAEQTNNTEVTIDDDDDVLAYDENGNPLSSEQRAALLEEQRKLYESIMKEKAANDAAIAQANADAFDMRSSNAAARAMSSSSPGGGTMSLADSNRAMDSVGRDVTQPTSTAGAAEGEQQTNADDEEAARRESRRMVKIGNNQMVALHGQDRTKKAIKEGTAILVQCINCQNWMQVTDTATLMFCPVCQVVSPVIQQNEVMTKEEAIQLTMDRKLAEKLQAEAYAQNEQGERGGETKTQEEEGYMARFFGGIGGAVADTVESATSSGSGSTAAQNERTDSWWDKISSIVSYGEPHTHERGELAVTRPPGAPASQYPAAAAAASRSPGTSNQNEETRGLLSPVVVDGNEANLPSARVGEANRPLFSCVTDSVNSAASALFHMGDESNVNGIDSSSLLVTNAGRGVGDGEGDYERLPDSERL